MLTDDIQDTMKWSNKTILFSVLTCGRKHCVYKAHQPDPDFDFAGVQWVVGVGNRVRHDKSNRIVNVLKQKFK